MRSRRFKRVVAWAGLIVLIGFAAYREIESAITRLRIAFADEQTAIDILSRVDPKTRLDVTA